MWAPDDGRAVLEDPSDPALGPADALAPQPVDRPDRLLPDDGVDRPGDGHPAGGRQAAREVEVLGQRRGTPATDRGQEITPDDDPVAAELRATAERPAPTLDLAVERLLVGLRAGQPRRVGVEDPPAGGDRPGTRPVIARQPTQEVGPDPGIRIEDDDHVTLACLGLDGGQRRTLAVEQLGAVAPDDASDRSDARCLSHRPGHLAGVIDRPVVDDDKLEPRRPFGGPMVLRGDVSDEVR